MKLQPFFFFCRFFYLCMYLCNMQIRAFSSYYYQTKDNCDVTAIAKKRRKKQKQRFVVQTTKCHGYLYIFCLSNSFFLFCFKWMSRGVGQGTGPTVSFNCRTTRLSLFLTLPSTLLSFRAFPNFLQTKKNNKIKIKREKTFLFLCDCNWQRVGSCVSIQKEKQVLVQCFSFFQQLKLYKRFKLN